MKWFPLSLSVLAALTLAACSPRTSQPAVAFTDYVAMGDSITAGMQSAGLTAQSQDAAFPVLLGQRGGLEVQMPEVTAPGCPAPMKSASDPISTESMNKASCTLLHPEVVSPVVAIPGARVADVYSTTDARVQNPDPLLYSSKLYRMVLGPGRTQLQAALARRPKFITLWVGANDVLLPTLRGTPEQATPPATFRVNYAHLLDALAPSGAKIVILTVPDVTRVPALVPVGLLGRVQMVDSSCKQKDGYFGTLSLMAATPQHPLACTTDSFLTPAKYEEARNTVTEYNRIIADLAAERGIAVFDVNPLLATMPGRPLIPTPSSPFGSTFSLDGVHPSSNTHRLLAQKLAEFMNVTYGTALNTW
ncbi:GDSL-type esterase/lipase family protein [Deinococcus radiomollis]|uniref:SGNH/GDSL hydrolase family protein n=1 Tax=Deinococcus radiomollis TaxID=468916 RepID=UPI00389264C0